MKSSSCGRPHLVEVQTNRPSKHAPLPRQQAIHQRLRVRHALQQRLDGRGATHLQLGRVRRVLDASVCGCGGEVAVHEGVCDEGCDGEAEGKAHFEASGGGGRRGVSAMLECYGSEFRCVSVNFGEFR